MKQHNLVVCSCNLTAWWWWWCSMLMWDRYLSIYAQKSFTFKSTEYFFLFVKKHTEKSITIPGVLYQAFDHFPFSLEVTKQRTQKKIFFVIKFYGVRLSFFFMMMCCCCWWIFGLGGLLLLVRITKVFNIWPKNKRKSNNGITKQC